MAHSVNSFSRPFVAVVGFLLPLLALGGAPSLARAQLTNQYDITASPYSCVASTSTSSADDSSCIQLAINAASSAGGGVVWVPSGFWNLKTQVVVKPNVTIQCVGNGYVYDANTLMASIPNYVSTGGAIFAINWGSGSGSSNTASDAAFQLQHSASIQNCGFWYPNQSATASSPMEYGSTILAYDSNANVHQNTIQNWCANCYNFLDYRGSISNIGVADMLVDANFGSPIHAGLLLNFWVDWAVIRSNWWNSGGIYQADPSPSSHLRGWIANNGIAYYLGENTGANLDLNSAYGYYIGVEMDLATDCCSGLVTTGPFRLNNEQFDGTYYDFYYTGPGSNSVTAYPVQINGGWFTAYNPYSNATGVVFYVANNSKLPELTLTGLNIFGPSGNIVQACQTTLTIGNVVATSVQATTSYSGGATAYALCSGSTATLKSLTLVGDTYTGYSALYTTGQTYSQGTYVNGNFQ